MAKPLDLPDHIKAIAKLCRHHGIEPRAALIITAEMLAAELQTNPPRTPKASGEVRATSH